MLSDPKVIARLNEGFVPYRFNVSDAGFPAGLPGLRLWQRYYKRHWRAKLGFFGHVVLDASGEVPLGTAGSGRREHFATSACYQSEPYRAFLAGSLERFAALTKARAASDAAAEHKVRRDSMRQILAANHVKWPR